MGISASMVTWSQKVFDKIEKNELFWGERQELQNDCMCYCFTVQPGVAARDVPAMSCQGVNNRVGMDSLRQKPKSVHTSPLTRVRGALRCNTIMTAQMR